MKEYAEQRVARPDRWEGDEDGREAFAAAREAGAWPWDQWSADDVRVSVAVMHAPWDDRRKATVDAQRRAIEGVPGVTSFSVVEADPEQSIWHTAHRAWRAALATGSTHHLVLQDDIGLSTNFVQGLRRVLAVTPTRPVGLFCVLKRVDEVRDAGWSFLPVRGGGWGAALVLPRPDVSVFLEWAAKHVHPNNPHDDVRFNAWASYHRHVYTWCTVPSLVEHMAPTDSLVGNNPPIDRTARWFPGHDFDARTVDWELPPPGEAIVQRSKDLWCDYHPTIGGIEKGMLVD